MQPTPIPSRFLRGKNRAGLSVRLMHPLAHEMKTNYILFLLVTACSLTGCLEQEMPKGDWSKEDVVGFRFVLDDPTNVWDLTFMSDGTCPVAMGTTNAVAGPIMRWRITDRGTLQVLQWNENPLDEWIHHRMQNDRAIIVNNAGITNIYKKTKAP